MTLWIAPQKPLCICGDASIFFCNVSLFVCSPYAVIFSMIPFIVGAILWIYLHRSAIRHNTSTVYRTLKGVITMIFHRCKIRRPAKSSERGNSIPLLWNAALASGCIVSEVGVNECKNHHAISCFGVSLHTRNFRKEFRFSEIFSQPHWTPSKRASLGSFHKQDSVTAKQKSFSFFSHRVYRNKKTKKSSSQKFKCTPSNLIT